MVSYLACATAVTGQKRANCRRPLFYCVPLLGYHGVMFAFFNSPYDWFVIALLAFLFFGGRLPTQLFAILAPCKRCGWRSLHLTRCLHCGWPK